MYVLLGRLAALIVRDTYEGGHRYAQLLQETWGDLGEAHRLYEGVFRDAWQLTKSGGSSCKLVAVLVQIPSGLVNCVSRSPHMRGGA